MRLISKALFACVLLSFPAFAQNSRSWTAPNNWDIAYAKGLGVTGDWGCAMSWDPPHPDHRVAWEYDRQMLMVSFLGPAVDQPELNGMPFVVSVDGKEIKRGLGAGTIVTLHSGEKLTQLIPQFVSWDLNNPQDSSRETREVFDILRHGLVLAVQAFGHTYTDDLRGIGAAIDLLDRCVAYADGL